MKIQQRLTKECEAPIESEDRVLISVGNIPALILYIISLCNWIYLLSILIVVSIHG